MQGIAVLDAGGPPREFVPFVGNADSLALRPYREYVRKRGVLEFAEAVGGGACLDGRFGGRVLVPHIVSGKWRGFSARAVMPGLEPKYLYPPGMQRRTALWGLEWAPDDVQPLWVVEGVFDALPLFPYGVATFGDIKLFDQLTNAGGPTTLRGYGADELLSLARVIGRLELRDDYVTGLDWNLLHFTPVRGFVSNRPEMSTACTGMVAKTYRPSRESVRLWMFSGQ